ncbi:MAG: hypothetical protein MUF04_02785, partial [Akkermansiaceae bacterium]|nr:hypothetical protein [Akkermansiaceae bacterium]
MRCCIDWRRIIAATAAALALGLWPAAPAQDAPPAAEDAPAAAPADPAAEDGPGEVDDDTPPTPAQEALERLRHGAPDVATLAEVLPLLPQPAHRELIRAKTVNAKPPPRAELVALLEHPYLAVRLGALELLEELAGTDHAFNPWQPAATPDNSAALARWRAWAGKK